MFEIQTAVEHTTDFCVYIIKIYNLEWTMKNDKKKTLLQRQDATNIYTYLYLFPM